MAGPRGGVILLDIPPGMDEHFDVSFLERTGHPVEVCRGPQDRPCPLLGGHGCPKLEAAHGIVFELDLDRAEHRAVPGGGWRRPPYPSGRRSRPGRALRRRSRRRRDLDPRADRR